VKLIISKSQWEKIGRLAGWYNKTLSDERVDQWIQDHNATIIRKINSPGQYKETWRSEDKTLSMDVIYYKFYEREGRYGSGYSFPCNPSGNLTMRPSKEILDEIRIGNFKKPVITKEGKFYISGCECGSGLMPEMEYDARGIEIGNMCNRCKKDRLSRFRRKF